MEKQHKQINDPSLWNNMVSTKIYTDDTLKEKNQQEAQDGEIQSLEWKEQNGITQLNQINQKIMM